MNTLLRVESRRCDTGFIRSLLLIRAIAWGHRPSPSVRGAGSKVIGTGSGQALTTTALVGTVGHNPCLRAWGKVHETGFG